MNMPIERNKHYYLIANKVNNLAALRLLTLSATNWTGIGNAPDSFTRKTTVHSPYFFRSNVWMTFPLASMKCQAKRSLVGLYHGESRQSAGEHGAVNAHDLRTRQGGGRVDHEVGACAIILTTDMLEAVDMSAGTDIHIAMLAKERKEEVLHILALGSVLACIGIHRMMSHDNHPILLRLTEGLANPSCWIFFIFIGIQEYTRTVGKAMPVAD